LKDLPTSRRRSVVFRPINLCRVRVRRLRNPAIKSGLLHANGTVPRPLPRGKTSRINGLARRRGIPFYLAIVRSVSHSLQSRAFIDSTTFRSDFGADCSPRNAAHHAVDIRLSGCQRHRLHVVFLFASASPVACGTLALELSETAKRGLWRARSSCPGDGAVANVVLR
jgi:hypothetical protein